MFEKEITLLKQVETLQKNQEENKVLVVANNIQMKLTEKKNKIDLLRSKLNACDTFINKLKKVILIYKHIYFFFY